MKKIKALLIKWLLNRISDEEINKVHERIEMWAKNRLFTKQVFLSDVPDNTLFYSQLMDEMFLKLNFKGEIKYISLKNQSLVKVPNQIVNIRKKRYEKGLL